MGLNEKSGFLAKTLVIIFLGAFFLHCNNKTKKINCDEINDRSALFVNQYYIDNNKEYLDSALYYTDKGIDKCSIFKNILSLRKLHILAEQQKFSEGVKFIETFDKEMFSDLPYFQELLINRFKAMEAIRENDNNMRDKYLQRCVNMIDSYLLVNKYRVDSLLKQSRIESILTSPLSTALTQYYYYKSVNNTKDVLKDLKEMKEGKNINDEFINYLKDYLQTDFMEFNGI
jgi:hypothetical protein